MIRLAVRVARAQAELVLLDLLELAPAGVEEVEHEDGTIEYAVYGAEGELPALPDLRALAGSALVQVSSRRVAEDWAQRWKRFHRPVAVAGPDGRDVLIVRPPWSAARSRGRPGTRRPAEVVIDPGQAFGTGAHATTRLCLELLVGLAHRGQAGGALCDVGCGSGVLAIAAHRLGYSPVFGVDNDPRSLDAARENAAANHVGLELERRDLRRDALPVAPTVTANLLRPLLLELAGRLSPDVTTIIAGGLLVDEADEVSGMLSKRPGLRERERAVRGEWAALLLA